MTIAELEKYIQLTPLREFAHQLARETRRVTPYVEARVTDEQFDADRARDSAEWCDE